jgi:DUF4097 and DUF4098 domain-containing protein YvlB
MSARYEIPPAARLRISSMSGSIKVIAEDRSDVETDPGRRMELVDGERIAQIKSTSSSLHVRCPLGTDVSAGTVSGGVKLAGRFGSVKVATISGSIEIDVASGDVDLRSVSGSLSVEACGGRCQLNTKSGSIAVGHVEKGIRASSLSGSVELGTAGLEDVEIRNVSGRLRVRVSNERAPHIRLRSVSGRLRCDCPEGTDFEIRATTISGSLEVTKE